MIVEIHKEPFYINGQIDGSAIYYTIRYINSDTGVRCSSVSIQSSSCINGLCHHVFDVSQSSCEPLTNISIVVVSSNVLGDGTPSPATLIG